MEYVFRWVARFSAGSGRYGGVIIAIWLGVAKVKWHQENSWAWCERANMSKVVDWAVLVFLNVFLRARRLRPPARCYRVVVQIDIDRMDYAPSVECSYISKNCIRTKILRWRTRATIVVVFDVSTCWGELWTRLGRCVYEIDFIHLIWI